MKTLRFAVVMVGFALSVAASAGLPSARAAEIDPYEVSIDDLASDAALTSVELRFAEIPEIRGLLRNSGFCFLQLTREELKRLHAAARLQRAEFLKIESDVRFATRKAVLDIGQDRLCRIQLQKSGSTGGNSYGRIAPVTQVEDFVLRAAREHVGEERLAGYREEVEDRRMHRQNALVTALTASLDSRLFLSDDQRGKISDLLRREWHDPWLLCIRQLLTRGVEGMPLLPKRQIDELLTPQQELLFSNLRWNPSHPPYVGPSDVTMAGHNNANAPLVDELEFVTAEPGGRL